MSQAHRDLGPHFARMRAEEAAPRTPEEEAALEARIVARIDAALANEPAQNHPVSKPLLVTKPPLRAVSYSPARLAMWLAAACLPLIVYAASRAASHGPPARIDRDPIARASTSAAPSPPPSADISVRSPPDPPRSALPARARPSAPVSPAPPPSGLVAKPLTAPEPGEDAVDTGSGSTLSAENRLFEEGTRAEREGNVEGALTALNRLVREFPRSPLAQNAMVRRFHLLARAERNAEAVDAARAYLAAYPEGFAQREADEIVRAANASETPVPKRE